MLHNFIRLSLGAALVFFLINSFSISTQIVSGNRVDLPSWSEEVLREGANHPKLESAIEEMLEIYQNRGIEHAASFAAQRNMDMVRVSIRVVMESSVRGIFKGVAPAAAQWLASVVEAGGGEVECLSLTRIQCLIPIEILAELSDMDPVRMVRIPLKALPQITTEGLSVTHADLWQSLPPYWGTEIKVGILDCGFKGVEGLVGVELPSEVDMRSFRSDGNAFDEEVAFNQAAHGTACAEIIHDMSPASSLVLAVFETETEFAAAVDWLLESEVSIILCPVGFLPAVSAGDGSGPICQAVEKAQEKGILWVSSAGNAAQWSWKGGFLDEDGDRWHNFQFADETNTIQGTEGTILTACLTWDDWGTWDGSAYSGSDQDYDLYLFRESPFTICAKSENVQSGFQAPSEIIRFELPYSGQYHLAVRKRSATGSSLLRLCVAENTSLQLKEPEGSLLTPADSPHALSVGAVLWGNDAYAAYSSRGPTADGRIKPDLAAPTGVSCAVLGRSGFNGSSASAAHVAGALALMKSKSPFGLGAIRTFLELRAVDLGPQGKDNLYGFGRLDLSQ